MDMGLHCIDLIQYITNSKARKVSALIGTKTFKYEVEDTASIIFEMDNGVYAYIESNFNIPDEAAKCRLEIYGTKGSMLTKGTIGQAEDGKLDVMILDNNLDYNAKQHRVNVFNVDIKVEFGNMYTKEIESFSTSILKGDRIKVTVEEELQIQKVVEITYE